MTNAEIINMKRSATELRCFIKARIRRIRETMANRGIDVSVLIRPENVFYFSNFNPIITSNATYFILTREHAFLLVHAIRRDHAAAECAMDEILCYGKWGETPTIADDAFDAMKKLLGRTPKVIGVEEDYASIGFIGKLREKLNAESFQDVAEDIIHQRLIKDSYEIDLCRISGHMVDTGIIAAIEALRSGASEAIACTEGQYAMRMLWHKKYQRYEVCGFSNDQTAQIDTLCVWCMSNERLNYGCDCPTGYVPQTGDLTMPMSWARIGGYNVENERSVMVGLVDSVRRRAYDAMLWARQEIFDRLRPGIVFEDLYFAAMKVYEDAGFSNILPDRCGHGMGLSSHEFPFITKGNKSVLAPGMVFTVEPGLMDADFGAVRHSDTVLITESGFEFLTQSNRRHIVIMTDRSSSDVNRMKHIRRKAECSRQ